MNIFFLIASALLSVDEARESAKEASAKAILSSTVPAVIICLDEQGNTITDPVVDEPICVGDEIYRAWPDLSHANATWGGCTTMHNAQTADFEYCAILDGGVARCTQNGCDFPRK